MGTRYLHERLCVSRSLARCSARAQDAWPRFLLHADPFGCFRMDEEVIKSRLWPLRSDVQPLEIAVWLKEYVEQGMVQLWETDGATYARLVNWDKYQRVYQGRERHTPTPPRLKTVAGSSPPPPYAQGAARECLMYFAAQFRRIVGEDYAIEWAKDLGVLKRIMRIYGGNKVRDLMDIFFEQAEAGDAWHSDKLSVGVFSTQINKLLIHLAKEREAGTV